MLPNGQEIKSNAQRFCPLVHTNITLVMLKFGWQLKICSKWLKVCFSHAGDQEKRLCVQCDRSEFLETCDLQSLLYRETWQALWTHRILRVFWINTINTAHVRSCFPDAKPQEYKTSLEKVSLSRENVFTQAHSVTNQEGKGWKKHLCSKHVYKAKNWKSDKLAPLLPRNPHNQ